MTQIDWVRATFVGAMLGGFVWAVIIGLASLDTTELPWAGRALVVAVAVNAVLVIAGRLLWRREQTRTLAAALWIVPFLGVAFVAAIFILGAGAKLAGS